MRPKIAIEKLHEAFSTRLSRFAVDSRLTPSHRDYRRFVIVGHGRTGSNLLRSMLNDHNAIIAFGELFRTEGDVGWDMRGYPDSANMIALHRADPDAFLEQYVFRAYPMNIHAIGFKLFYQHAQSGTQQTLWQALQEDTNVRILHLKRINKLRTYLSLERARRTDQWVVTQGQRARHIAISLDPRACAAFFEQTTAYENETDARFANHHKLEVTYEALVADRDRAMSQVQQFLGMMPTALRPRTHRQANDSLNKAIKNFAALSDHFAGTRWAPYFE